MTASDCYSNNRRKKKHQVVINFNFQMGQQLIVALHFSTNQGLVLNCSTFSALFEKNVFSCTAAACARSHTKIKIVFGNSMGNVQISSSDVKRHLLPNDLNFLLAPQWVSSPEIPLMLWLPRQPRATWCSPGSLQSRGVMKESCITLRR